MSQFGLAAAIESKTGPLEVRLAPKSGRSGIVGFLPDSPYRPWLREWCEWASGGRLHKLLHGSEEVHGRILQVEITRNCGFAGIFAPVGGPTSISGCGALAPEKLCQCHIKVSYQPRNSG